MFAAVLFALLHAAGWQTMPGPGGVTLGDAFEFGHRPDEVRQLWRQAINHRRDVRWAVRAYNPPAVADEWERETRWRERAWDLLDDAAYHPYGWKRKLESLAELRGHIGAEMYDARRMPLTTPQYRKLP